jgi:hypothetical protein
MRPIPSARRSSAMRTIGILMALAAVSFATAGFIVGLNFTVRGGHLPDVVYHVALLPVFIGSFVELLRVDRAAT